MNELQAILNQAHQAVGGRASFDADGNVRSVYRQPAASIARYSMREMFVPALASNANRITHTPVGAAAGKRTTLADAVLANSRCAAAGAHIGIIPAEDGATINNGELVYRQREYRLDVIDAAEFAVIPDGDELAASALPLSSAAVNLDTMPSLGVHIPLSRAEQKAYADGYLADTALTAIIAGIARAADATLLAAIAASDPAAFSLGAAAGLGSEFGSLRALVGTAGAGAAVDQDGTLRAAGVLAELTPDTTATVVGAWNRAAVAVSEDISLIAERMNTVGDLKLTAWVSMQALLPQPGAFWTVAA